MKININYAGALLCLVVTFGANAYKYSFINLSNKQAEVQFKLVGINEPTETVVVPPMTSDGKPGSASKFIGSWRIGLCMDPRSIRIRYLPDGQFKIPVRADWCVDVGIMGHCSSRDLFELFLEKKTIASLKEYIQSYRYDGTNAKNTEEFAAATQDKGLYCFDQTFTFSFADDENYPVIKRHK